MSLKMFGEQNSIPHPETIEEARALGKMMKWPQILRAVLVQGAGAGFFLVGMYCYYVGRHYQWNFYEDGYYLSQMWFVYLFLGAVFLSFPKEFVPDQTPNTLLRLGISLVLPLTATAAFLSDIYRGFISWEYMHDFGRRWILPTLYLSNLVLPGLYAFRPSFDERSEMFFELEPIDYTNRGGNECSVYLDEWYLFTLPPSETCTVRMKVKENHFDAEAYWRQEYEPGEWTWGSEQDFLCFTPRSGFLYTIWYRGEVVYIHFEKIG